MGIFGKLFPSDEERRRDADRENRRERRRALRKIGASIDDCALRSTKLRAQSKEEWDGAIVLLRQNKKAEAQQRLQKYRWFNNLVVQLERKKFVLEKYAIQLENAAGFNMIEDALVTMSKVISLDPEKIVAPLTNVEGATEELSEIDNLFEQIFEKEMGVVDQSNCIQTFEEIYRAAVTEARAESNPQFVDLPENVSSAKTSEEITREIAAGRRRLEEMSRQLNETRKR